jgi:hypothetical protein
MPEPRAVVSGKFTVNPDLVKAILAAVAFLYADDLPQGAYEAFNDPSERVLDSLNKLVEIRMGTS